MNHLKSTVDVDCSDRLQLMAAWDAVVGKYDIESGLAAAASQYGVVYDLYEGLCDASDVGAPAAAIEQMMDAIRANISRFNPGRGYKVIVRRPPEISRPRSFETGRQMVKCSCRLHFQPVDEKIAVVKDADAGEFAPIRLVVTSDDDIAKAKVDLMKDVPDDCDGFAIVWFTRKRDGTGTVNARASYHVKDAMDAFHLPHIALSRLTKLVQGGDE